MTKVLILSDLHQGDGGPPFDPSAIKNPFDVAVVAGDCAGRLTSSIEWLADRFSGVPTVYVPGNHDFYRSGGAYDITIESELAASRDLAASRGVALLSDDTVEMGGLRFAGATLWTDLHSGNHLSLSHAMGEARRGMYDFRRIHRGSSTRRSRRITPAETRSWHIASRRFLELELAGMNNVERERTVVVSHHAPSLRSLADPSDPLAHCYASDLTQDIERWQPRMWVHGHNHRICRYSIGSTLIIANPLGRAEELTGFDASLTIDV